jgi:hypothetical protein
MQDCREAHQHNKELQQVGQSAVSNKPVDHVEQNGADNDDDEYVKYYKYHGSPHLRSTPGSTLPTLSEFDRRSLKTDLNCAHRKASADSPLVGS